MGSTSSAKERIVEEFFDLSFSVHKSRRYHEKLAAFYSGWRDAMKIATAIAGSGAFLLISSGWQDVATVVVAFIALWAVIDIIFAPDKKSDLHSDLRQKFISLAAEIEAAPRTKESLRALAADRLSIEAREPPCKRLVDLQARNDECRARGFLSSDLVPLSDSQRYLGYFATFGMSRLEKWKASNGE